MFTKVAKTVKALFIGLCIATLNMANAQAIEADAISYDGASACAAMFTASAKVLQKEPNSEDYKVLSAASEKLTDAAIRLSPNGEQAARDSIEKMVVAIESMTNDEYSEFINEFGQLCVDITLAL